MRSLRLRNLSSLILALIMAAGMLFTFTSPPASADGTGIVPLHIVTSCAAFCTEGRADAEWCAYLAEHEKVKAMECRLVGLPSDAWRTDTQSAESIIYGCADEESREKLFAVANKYVLQLHSDISFSDSTDGMNLPAIRGIEKLEPEYSCSDGAFGVSGRLKTDGWYCDFLYEECPAGVMGFWSRRGCCEKYSQWSRTLPDGTELMLDLGPADSGGHSGFYEVRLFQKREGKIITVLGSVPNGREGAEKFADCFNFS